MKKNRLEVLLFGIFAATGILLLIIGVIVVVNQSRFQMGAVPVAATISSIESYQGSDGDMRHRVCVDYNFQGREYKEMPLNYFSSGMYVGQELTLYCDPAQPAKVRAKGAMMLAPLILAFMGVIFTLIGGLPMLHFAKKNRCRKKLLQSGRALYAEVEGVDFNTSYTVNGRHPYVLYCHYRDPYSDITYRFKSDNLWTDPAPYFPAGAEVEVLVMEGDYSTYHVNVERVLESRVVDYT